MPRKKIYNTWNSVVRDLTAASTDGQLLQVQKIFSQWMSKPRSEPPPGFSDLQYLPGHTPDGYSQIFAYPFISALCTAIEHNHLAIVRYLLDHGLPINQLVLEYAFKIRPDGADYKARSIDIFQAFVDHGWDINCQWSAGFPSSLRLVLDDEKLTRWFLAHGADPNAACDYGYTPLGIGCSYAPLHIIQLLIAHGGDVRQTDALHGAASGGRPGRVEVLAYLLDCGAPIDAIDREHHKLGFHSFSAWGLGTALHCAAQKGHLDEAALLLERGANRDIKDTRGRTALELAQKYGHEEVVKLLSDWPSASMMSMTTIKQEKHDLDSKQEQHDLDIKQEVPGSDIKQEIPGLDTKQEIPGRDIKQEIAD